MAKIEIQLVAASLKNHGVEPSILREIIEELNFEAQPDPDEEKAPPVKKQFVIVLSKPADPVATALQTVLDQVDYTTGACGPAHMVGACLDSKVIELARKALSGGRGDLTGWVAQIPEDASPFSAMDRVFKGAYDYNASKKGHLLPVKSVGEAFEAVSAKYFKEAELWLKTKMPVAVVMTDNQIPKDEFKTERVDHRSNPQAV